MSEQSEDSGKPSPQRAAEQHPGIKIPESVFTKYIKPILGKLITAGIILILLIILINILIKSIKKDDTFKLMQQQNELLEKQRLQEQKDRKVLIELLDKSHETIRILDKRDSLLKISIAAINDNISRIKISYNEKIKIIEHFNSADLLEYYRNLPEPQPDNDY